MTGTIRPVKNRKTGEVYRDRHELVWEAAPGQDGKRRQETRTFRGTKKDAQKELTSILNGINEGTHVEATKMTVGDLLNRWLRDIAKPNVGNAAYDRYEEVVRVHLIPAFGALPLEKLKTMQIQAFYAEKLVSLSPGTVRYIHGRLRSALKQAVVWGLLKINPADAVEKPRKQKSKLNVYDESQVADLLAATEGTVYHFPVFLAIHTGMRVGEICALKWDDIDFEAGTVRIDENLEKSKSVGLRLKCPKNGDTRTIPVSGEVISVLRERRVQQLRQGQGTCEFVFPLEDGGLRSPINFSRMWCRWIRASGLPLLRFHDLRHSHATLLLQKGKVPLKIVADRLGHRNPAITLGIYGNHVLAGMDREAADVMGRLLQPDARQVGT